jgi:hypothetical protein
MNEKKNRLLRRGLSKTPPPDRRPSSCSILCKPGNATEITPVHQGNMYVVSKRYPLLEPSLQIYQSSRVSEQRGKKPSRRLDRGIVPFYWPSQNDDGMLLSVGDSVTLGIP